MEFQREGGGGIEVLNKERAFICKFQRSIKKEIEFLGLSKKKYLEFPRGVTQFCKIFKGEGLFSLEFLSKGKMRVGLVT